MTEEIMIPIPRKKPLGYGIFAVARDGPGLKVNLSPVEKATLAEAASICGVKMSQFSRQVVLSSAEEIIKIRDRSKDHARRSDQSGVQGSAGVRAGRRPSGSDSKRK